MNKQIIEDIINIASELYKQNMVIGEINPEEFKKLLTEKVNTLYNNTQK